MQYRREIDGLRAVAVIPVIFFHAGFTIFSGGYVGVDIFFVISGYLITSIIISELEQGKFSILRFYERRARRILPALFFVMLACIPFAWMWMLPDPLENFGQSIVATTLFSNNILLILTANYWDWAVDFKPLVHTWSLAVEEQYYVLFPILLILLWRFGRSPVFYSIIAISIISLLLSEWGWRNKPETNFYFAPTRAWELLAGSICAFLQFGKIQKSHNGLSALGLALIVFAIFFYGVNTPFPSVYALVPVVGTALIIMYGAQQTWVAKLLSLRSFVGIGLISYSAYLWHQPLFAFMRILSKREPTISSYTLAILLTLICSFLTWKFIESPFRKQSFMSRNGIFILVFSVGFTLTVAGLAFHFQHGFPSRMYAKSEAISADMYITYNHRVFEYKKDHFESPDKVHVLVLGNSFARDFVNMMSENLPFETIELVYRDEGFGCLDQTSDSLASLLVEQSHVIIFASGEARLACEREHEYLYEIGKSVFYVGTKHFGYNLNWLVRVPSEQRYLASNYLMQTTIELDSSMREKIPTENYIDIIGKISNDESSIIVTDERGRLLSRDRTHLTKHGAQFVGERVLNNPILLKALGLPIDMF